jgi:hypothetical protein
VLLDAELPSGSVTVDGNAASVRFAPTVGLFMQQLWLIVGDCR